MHYLNVLAFGTFMLRLKNTGKHFTRAGSRVKIPLHWTATDAPTKQVRVAIALYLKYRIRISTGSPVFLRCYVVSSVIASTVEWVTIASFQITCYQSF
jgi:hypothetical protein